MKFNRVTDVDFNALAAICPDGRTLLPQDISDDYAHDEMPIYGSYMPEALVYPTSAEEVQQIMRYCHSRRIPVTPRGSGTGLCGGAVPRFGGVLLSTERMNRILEVDRENMTATVEPGVLLMDFSAHVLEQGLFYPPEPGEKSATLGGNVMTNAGGMKAVKYGVTRDYVMGMQAVLANGDCIDVGGKVVKNSSGYSLLHVLVGSEGTLAIATKLILKLIPKPACAVSLLVPFASLDACIKTVPELFLSQCSPTAIEFIQREVILASEEYLGREFPDKTADAYLLLSFDGQNRAQVDAMCDKAAEICIASGAVDALYADTEERLSAVWDARGAFLEAIKASTSDMDECDVVVPRNRIADFVTFTQELERESGVRIRSFGHAGDGNIHVYVCRDGMGADIWQTQLDSIMRKLYDKAAALAGKVSGEHGIGHAKIGFMEESEGPAVTNLMAGIKRAFDPDGILNPGKVTNQAQPRV